MTISIDVRSRAERQVDEADDWWRENRPAAPDLFRQEFEKAISTLARTPDVGMTYKRRGIPNLRRLLMLRTQYHIYYIHQLGSDSLQVISVWNALRRRGPPLASTSKS